MSKYEFRKLLNFLGFVATIIIAIAVVIAFIFKEGVSSLGFSNVQTALVFIASVIAYFITAVSGFYYARSKKNIAFLITWIVAVVLITVFLFLNAFA